MQFCCSFCEVCAVGCAAADQPVNHILQLDTARGTAGQEDHGAWLLVFLHPRQDEPTTPQPRLPRLPTGPWTQPCLLRCVLPTFASCSHR